MYEAQNHYSLELVAATGQRIPASVDVFVRAWTDHGQLHRPCTVKLSWAAGSVDATAHSVYHAFQEIRRQLEPAGLVPYCFGSCPDVQVSGMQCDMGDGTFAYRMSTRAGEGSPETVNIFESDVGLVLGSVERQRGYLAAELPRTAT